MEFVFVTKRTELFQGELPQGFTPLAEGEIAASVLDPVAEKGFFVERRHAENDPSLKQIIPYCVVAREDELFVLKRLPAGGEKRLQGKRSVGVGGHINPVDDDAENRQALVRNAADREVDEEIHLTGEWTMRPVGIVNDDSNDVGSVHLGVVFQITCLGGTAEVREIENLEGRFETLDDVMASLDADPPFETWSRFVLEGFAHSKPAVSSRHDREGVQILT